MSFVSHSLTALNYITNIISLGNHKENFTQDRLVHKFSPEEQRQRIEDYATSMGFDPKHIPGEDTFKKYETSRISSVLGFAGLQIPGKKTTIGEALEKKGDADAQAKLIKEKISAALATAPDKTKFLEDMGNIQAAVTSGIKTNTNHIIHLLHEVHSETHERLNAAFETEKKQFEELFKDPTFTTPLQETLGLDSKDPAALEAVKKAMLDELVKSHTKRLADFDKAMSSQLAQAHAAAKKEQNRIFVLATLYEGNPYMKKQIDALINLRQKGGSSGATIVAEPGSARAIFSGINLSDLDIRSLTGSQLKQNSDGSFSIDISSLNIAYAHSSDNNILVDAKMIVAVLNTDKIKLQAQSPDHEHALKLGRALFQAAVESGRDLKDITITVNGNVIPGDKAREELFKGNEQAHDVIIQTGQKNKATREANLTAQTGKPGPDLQTPPVEDTSFAKLRAIIKGRRDEITGKLKTHVEEEAKAMTAAASKK